MSQIAFGQPIPIRFTTRQLGVNQARATISNKRRVCHCAACDPETEKAIQAETVIMAALGLRPVPMGPKADPKLAEWAKQVGRKDALRAKPVMPAGERLEFPPRRPVSREEDEQGEVSVNLGLAKRSARMAARPLYLEDLESVARNLSPAESWSGPCPNK